MHDRALTLTALALALAIAGPRAAADDHRELSSEVSRSAGADLFVIDGADNVEHLWQVKGAWTGRESLHGAARDIVTHSSEGRFEVFVVGTDNGVWHNSQRAGQKGWSGWEALGGDTKRIALAKNRAGRLELFAIGNDDAVWHCGRAAKAKTFSPWQTLGGWAEQLAAAEADGGGFRVFVVGRERAVWQRTTTGGEWENMGAVAKDVSAARLTNGGFEVFVVGDDDALWHNRQPRPGAAWNGWQSLGGSAVRISSNMRKAGTLVVFALKPDGDFASLSQTSPSKWGSWQPLRGATKPSAAPTQPLDARFTGTATMSISEFDVSETRNVNLGIRFNAARDSVQITEFPPIVTKRFKTPFGSSKSTVTLASSSPGRYDRSTGHIVIPVKLAFDQSLDVPVVDEDAGLEVELKTDAEGGSAVDVAGQVTLVADGAFRGKGNVNPLNRKTCRVVIRGALAPAPGRGARK